MSCVNSYSRRKLYNIPPRRYTGESFARGPKLLSIKNDVIEIMT